MASTHPTTAPGVPEPTPLGQEALAHLPLAMVRAARSRVVLRWVLALLGLATALRLGLILRGWPALDSDEAIIGLMARHILFHGEHPIFYYGQHYLGALDAYLAAGMFTVLGPTTLALHFSMLPLTLGFLLVAYALGRAAYGTGVGLLTLAVLAVGPAYALLRETATIGGYQETLLLGGALLLLVYARLRRPEPLPRDRAEWATGLGWYALMGVIAGLGLWSDQLILPIIIAAVLALLCGRSREMRHLPLVALAVGLILGGWPLFAYNVQHGGATFTELASQNRVAGQVGPLPPLGSWLSQIGSMLTVGLPALLGSPHVCVARGGAWPSYPPALVTLGQASGVCAGLNLLFAVSVLGCLVVAGVPLVRGAWSWWQARSWRRRALAAAGVGQREAAARRWLRAMLLLSAGGTLLLYSISKTAQLYQFTAARYLLPFYLALPMVVGVLWEHGGRRITARLRAFGHEAGLRGLSTGDAAASTGHLKRSVYLASGGLIVLLGFSVYGGIATVAWAGNATRFALPEPATDQQLIATLTNHGVTTFVSDYWTCYRLAFESGERLRCAVRDGTDGTLTRNGAVNRYLPYLEETRRAPHPAYVFPAGSSQDTTFDTWAGAQGLPHTGYLRLVAAGEAIFYYPAPAHA